MPEIMKLDKEANFQNGKYKKAEYLLILFSNYHLFIFIFKLSFVDFYFQIIIYVYIYKQSEIEHFVPLNLGNNSCHKYPLQLHKKLQVDYSFYLHNT